MKSEYQRGIEDAATHLESRAAEMGQSVTARAIGAIFHELAHELRIISVEIGERRRAAKMAETHAERDELEQENISKCTTAKGLFQKETFQGNTRTCANHHED